VVFVDVTARKKAEKERLALEARVQHAQKLESLGVLAGGIAHDFNNLLTVIGGYTSILRDASEPAELDECAAAIEQAHDKAVNLTRQLLAFGRRQILRPRVFQLGECVRGLEQMLRRLIGEHIELLVEQTDERDKVFADPGQIEQVIMNLVVNARDAMSGGGRIRIGIHRVGEGHGLLDVGSVAPAAPHVVLTVSDTGCGMDDETMARIFEPFFTTKPQERGTGLGLSTVFGIVQQSGGTIQVQSTVGHGSTFEIRFPAADDRPEQLGGEPTMHDHLRGSGTVLVTDDDASVLELVTLLLRRQGYHVLQASNAEEALHIAAENASGVDLLLTDLVMPGMSGNALAECFKEHHPDAAVVYMSGYADDTIRDLDPSVPFISKPFTAGELLGLVGDAIKSKMA
jgi:nitrogen-specific signal transduction histidine kinase